MKVYGECCPHCGTWNENLYLDETDGYYECENCHEVVQSEAHKIDLSQFPIFDMGNPEDMKRLAAFCDQKSYKEFRFRKPEKVKAAN